MKKCLLKKLNVIATATAALVALPFTASAQLPSPTYGWNLGNTMEPPSGVGTWGPQPTQLLINAVKKSGFNTVRIPCAWDSHANQTTLKIDPAYMSQVKQVVDWCMAANLYVVINDHWDNGWLENHLTGTVNPTIDGKMNSYWTQIAKVFAKYNNHLLFAAANEPNVKDGKQMTELLTYYQTFVDAIRLTGNNNITRWLVVQGPNADIDATNSLMSKLPSDVTRGRLMVEVHDYTPYQFTLMSSDQSWGKMFYFWGQGYHSTADPVRNATWGEEVNLDSEFQKMFDKFVNLGVPVMIGEFRAEPRKNLPVIEQKLNIASTTYWNKYLVDSARSHGMFPVCWDTPGQMFDWSKGTVLDQNAILSLTGRSSVPPPGGDGSQYGFELGTQGFVATGAQISSIATSNAQRYAGTQSLKLAFSGSAAGTSSVSVVSPSVPAGNTLSFRVWVPSGSKISAVQPYIQDRKWVWTGTWKPIGNLTPNRWNTITLTVPPTAATPLHALGVQFVTSSKWTGACYLDSIGW